MINPNKVRNYALLVFIIFITIFLTFSPVFGKSVENKNYSKDIDSKSLKEANAVLKIINKERAKYSIKPLKLDKRLLKLSKSRSMEISNKVNHVRPNGKYFSSISHLVFAENIGVGYKSPKKFAKATIKSERHRKNILNPRFKTIGISYSYVKNGVGGYKWYWSQLFGLDSKYKYKKVTGLKVSKKEKNDFTISWDRKKSPKIEGYQILEYNSKLKKYKIIKINKGNKNTKFNKKNYKKGSTYQFKIKSFSKGNKKTYYGIPSASLKVHT